MKKALIVVGIVALLLVSTALAWETTAHGRNLYAKKQECRVAKMCVVERTAGDGRVFQAAQPFARAADEQYCYARGFHR